MGLQLRVLNASSQPDFERAFATLSELRAGALIIGADGFFVDQSKQLAALSLRHVLPTISLSRDFVTVGGLMSYGGELTEALRLMGVYTGPVFSRATGLPTYRFSR